MVDVWEEHAEVYHYTTLSGLKGILESQTLHATHFAFLNDPKEIYQIRPRLVETALPITAKLYEDVAAANQRAREGMDAVGGIPALAAHDAAGVVESLYRVTLGLDGGTRFFQPYVVSFCGHKEPYEREHGLLSQWRGYGKDSGYAIVFDTKALVDALRIEMAHNRFDSWGMGGVVYDTGGEVFKEEFKILIGAMEEDLPRLLKNEGGPYSKLNQTFMIRWSRLPQGRLSPSAYLAA